jgi:ribosomal protein S18 acetylase RimI-like enzyme
MTPSTWRAFLADDGHHLLIAYLHGEPAGFVSAAEVLHPDKPGPEMFLNELGVSPAFRRKGVATTLLEELIELCKDRGCSEMWVLTDEENTPAMLTYERTGGKREPRDSVMFTFEFE